MKIISSALAVAVLSFSGNISGAVETKALSSAGLSLANIEVPAPETPKNNQWLTLRKITVNTAQPDMNDTLVGLVRHGENIDKVVKELTEGGFKATAVQDNSGGYLVMVCLLYTSPSPRDRQKSRMPSSA